VRTEETICTWLLFQIRFFGVPSWEGHAQKKQIGENDRV